MKEAALPVVTIKEERTASSSSSCSKHVPKPSITSRVQISLNVTLSKTKGLLYNALCACMRRTGATDTCIEDIMVGDSQSRNGNRTEPFPTLSAKTQAQCKQDDQCESVPVDETAIIIDTFIS